MRHITFGRLLLVVSALAIGVATAQESSCTQHLGTTTIEWTRGRIYVVGEGLPVEGAQKGQKRLTAATAAETKALRSLASIIGGIRVSSQTETLNSALASDRIRTEVEQTIKAGTLYTDSNHPLMKALGYRDLGWNAEDEVYKVVMEVPLFGPHGAAQAVFPLTNLAEAKPPAHPGADLQFADVPPSDSSSTPEVAVTGLIVDCTRADVEPAMSPKVYNAETKQAIYGLGDIDTATAVNRGIVGYETSLEAAKKAAGRVGANPMVVPAAAVVATQGTAAVSVAVSASDAQRILDADKKGGFLRTCSVMFVVKAP